MKLLPSARRLSVLTVSLLALSGCGRGLQPCAAAAWVDQVEDDWLTVTSAHGHLQTLARNPERAHWREGNAILNGQVNERCERQLHHSIRALRETLLK